jgi:deazaflavin-dependent oxidoreductase (nitroreductase family)
MLTMLATLAGALVLGIAVVAALYVLGMRAKAPLILRPLIRLQRAMINPRQMRSAGTPGAYASVIRHRGRTTGRLYETPVGAVPTEDGFVIALVYGSRTQWLRNVLASGSATIVHEGQAHEVVQPELVATRSVEALFPEGDRRGFRLLGVSQCLRVRLAEPVAEGVVPAAEAPRSDRAAHLSAGTAG